MRAALKVLTRSFQYRNYRLFFGGQLLSLIGTWVSNVATSWLVYRLTGSTFLLGAMTFASQFPTAVFSPFAGVIVDRMDRRRVLLWTQSFSMLQSFLLAGLTLAGAITVNELLVLGAIQGCINSFDIPARQVLMSDIIVDRQDLPNAIALNSAMFNGARLLGPSIGGLIIALTGEGVCFLIDGCSFLAVIFSLFSLEITANSRPSAVTSAWTDLKQGVSYVAAARPINRLLLLIASVSLFGTAYIVLLPVFVKTIFLGGPTLLGFLMAASGLGAFLGATALALRKTIFGLGRIIGLAGLGLSISAAAFAASTNLFLAALLIFLAGFSMIVMMAACNSLIQSLVDDHMRGRVMSFYAMAFMGMMPIGSLLSGSLATHIGVRSTVISGACICFIAAALFLKNLPALRKEGHQILAAKGMTVPSES